MSCGSTWCARPATWLLVALIVRVAACRDYAGSAPLQTEGGEAGSEAHSAAGGASAGSPLGAGAGGGSGSLAGGDTRADLGGTSAGAEAGDGVPEQGGAPGVDLGAGGTGASGEPTVSSPEAFKQAGLVLWLEASACDYDEDLRVEACRDQSGYGNDALQPSLLARPLLVPDGLGGRATLHFDGSPAPPSLFAASILEVADSESLHFGVDDFTVILVGRWNNDANVVYTVDGDFLNVQYGGYGGFLGKTEPNGLYAGLSIFGNYPLGTLNLPTIRRFAAQLELGRSVVLSASNNLNDGRYRVYTVRRYDNDWLALRINGKSNGVSQVTRDVDASAFNQPLLIGGGSGQPLRGDIAELVWIKATTSEQEVGLLEQGLMVKYGLDERAQSAARRQQRLVGCGLRQQQACADDE